MSNLLFEYDRNLRECAPLLCGVDEAGRGPLAGPVVAAAVVLPSGLIIEGVNDSKKLSEKKREELFDKIIQNAVSYAVCMVGPEVIDEINILNATLCAMQNSVEQLCCIPDIVLVDGNRLPRLSVPARAVIKGDGLSASIAAASILAKVTRDRYMVALSQEFPQYRLEQHKGYPTKLHYECIEKYGVQPFHRRSFLKNRGL